MKACDCLDRIDSQTIYPHRKEIIALVKLAIRKGAELNPKQQIFVRIYFDKMSLTRDVFSANEHALLVATYINSCH